jgi:hypothetical protein
MVSPLTHIFLIVFKPVVPLLGNMLILSMMSSQVQTNCLVNASIFLQVHDITEFHEITGLPNICRTIDGTHIPLADRPNWRVTLTQGDFFNRKKFHSIML